MTQNAADKKDNLQYKKSGNAADFKIKISEKIIVKDLVGLEAKQIEESTKNSNETKQINKQPTSPKFPNENVSKPIKLEAKETDQTILFPIETKEEQNSDCNAVQESLANFKTELSNLANSMKSNISFNKQLHVPVQNIENFLQLNKPNILENTNSQKHFIGKNINKIILENFNSGPFRKEVLKHISLLNSSEDTNLTNTEICRMDPTSSLDLVEVLQIVQKKNNLLSVLEIETESDTFFLMFVHKIEAKLVIKEVTMVVTRSQPYLFDLDLKNGGLAVLLKNDVLQTYDLNSGQLVAQHRISISDFSKSVGTSRLV